MNPASSALAVSVVALILLAAPNVALAQNLSIGIIGGGGLTDGFSTGKTPGNIHFVSTSKDYLIGPTVEWRSSQPWSLEADALFRELHLGLAATQPNGSIGSISPSPVVTWEFPVLAKYRFSSSRVRPLLEAGPSFRTAGNLNGTSPSHFGLTAGTGLEMQGTSLVLEPVLRYTRWAKDDAGDSVYRAKSNSNQLELAMRVSVSPGSNMHPVSSRISIGVLVGTGLTDDIRTTTFGFANGAQSFSSVTASRRGILLGPAIDLKLRAEFSLEVNAVYDPLRGSTTTISNGASPMRYASSIGSWDIPVLAKQRFRARWASPFVEAGPTFRVGTGQLSHYGITGGIGLEAHTRRLKIAPGLRYSHWAATPYGEGVIANQLALSAEFLL